MTDYIYFGGETTQTVWKAKKPDLVKVAESPNYGGEIYAVEEDNDYIYVGGATEQTIWKLQKSNLARVASSNKKYGGTIESITEDDDYVYAGGVTNQKIWKIQKSDMSVLSVSSANFGGDVDCLGEDADYIYAGIGGTKNAVYKLQKSDMSKIASSQSYGDDILDLTCDSNYVYAGGLTAFTVWKIQKSDMSRVASSQRFGDVVRAVDNDTNYVYVGGGTPDRVWKLNKSDMSLNNQTLDFGGPIRALSNDTDYIYYSATFTLPRRSVIRIRKSDMKKVGGSSSYGGDVNSLVGTEETPSTIGLRNLDIWFNSGGTSPVHYQIGNNIQSIEITSSDDMYYQNGIISIFSPKSSQTIGDTCKIYINNNLQFDGYLARRTRYLDAGTPVESFQLIGKTYNLWRYPTSSDALYTGTTGYIASSLVSTYCVNISGGNLSGSGFFISNELDLRYMTVGDALIQLTNFDRYKFFIDENNMLQYYTPSRSCVSFLTRDSDYIKFGGLEEADEDLVNDCLVEGSGQITARAFNQASINTYGRFFKKIYDSTITTEGLAQNRADFEVSGMEAIPRKGTIVIDGKTEGLSADYKFTLSSQYLGISEDLDIVGYTQKIDRNGFTTVINYGIQPFDVMKKISVLE